MDSQQLQELFPNASASERIEFAALVRGGALTAQRQELTAPAPTDAAAQMALQGLQASGQKRELAQAALRWLVAQGNEVESVAYRLFPERCELCTADGGIAVLTGAVSPALALAHLAAGRQVLAVPYAVDDGPTHGVLLKPTPRFSENMTKHATA